MAAAEMGEVDEIHSNEENIKDGASVNGDISDYKEDDDITNEVIESGVDVNKEDQDPNATDHEKSDEDNASVHLEDVESVEENEIEENELEENEVEENKLEENEVEENELEDNEAEEDEREDNENEKMEVEEIIHDDDSNEQALELDDQVHEIDNSDVEEETKSEEVKIIAITNGLNSSDEVIIETNSNDKNCEVMNDSGEDVVMLDDNKDPVEVLDDRDPIEVLDDDNKDPIENGSVSESGDDLEISEATSTQLTFDEGDVISVDDSPAKKKKKERLVDSGPPRRSSRNLNKERKSYIEDEEEEYLKEQVKKQEEQQHSSEESDIEEVMPQDPLAVADPPPLPALQIEKTISKKSRISSSTIVVKDTKCLAEIASKSTANNNNNNKKEPTLVIIDTNSILSGRGPVPIAQKPAISSPISNSYSMLPMALPAQGVYPANMRATITPIPMTPPAPPPQPPKPAPPPPPPVPVLPTLTDDMFVVEAPSFIVPYVYEKPPIKDLKDFVKGLESEIAEQKKKTIEEKEKRELEKAEKEKEQEKEKLANDKVKSDEDKEKSDEGKEKSDEGKKKSDEGKEKSDEGKEKSQKGREDDEKKESEVEKQDAEKMDVNKESADIESSIDKEFADKTVDGEKEENTSVDSEKENKDEITQEKTTDTDLPSMPLPTATTLAAELRKPPATYFDSPLGKFFMGIGYSLVQEAVQSDLLKQQKRRRDREGGQNPETMKTINSLTKNLEYTKENNEPYHMETKKCEFCSFKTESALAMAYHLETPHMKNFVYRCNFCSYEVRSPHDILFHMEVQHGVRGRLERAPAFHQCPNCPFEDNQKGKLSRHLVACTRKFKPDRNLEPPADYEPPAKIPRAPRMKQQGLGTAAAVYQAMARSSQYQMMSKMSSNLPAMQRGRGRPSLGTTVKTPPGIRQPAATSMLYKQGNMSGGSVLVPTNYQLSGNQLYQVVGGQEMGGHLGPGGATAFLPNISATPNSITIQQQQPSPLSKMKPVQQPSISITPLPRGTTTTGVTITKPGDSNPKNSFVICEICDGYIKDLEQLRNHMQWIHKVKIHPKMIYNRPPLNCQKCQFRFFTDQGLERHLLGSHGLVTSSMQEAANRSKDAGRCPVCGRVYQWKLLNHVARDHNMTLKPAHLSYKCTVCTATFGMYKQFESHVYSAHSVVAKRVMDKKNAATASANSAAKNESVLKPLKINDEITIIPQPAKPANGASSSKEDSTPSTSGTSISARNNVAYSNGNPGTSKSMNEPRNEPSSSTSLSRSERLARRKTASQTDN